jgi:hypothetical protein
MLSDGFVTKFLDFATQWLAMELFYFLDVVMTLQWLGMKLQCTW